MAWLGARGMAWLDVQRCHSRCLGMAQLDVPRYTLGSWGWHGQMPQDAMTKLLRMLVQVPRGSTAVCLTDGTSECPVMPQPCAQGCHRWVSGDAITRCSMDSTAKCLGVLGSPAMP